MTKTLVPHPVSLLFPPLAAADFAALKEDIRRNGMKVPILVHGGQILDGRHRYRACQELGIRCSVVEWNGHDPWLEAQSRNLVRRHLAKDQVYAIRKLAAQQFPELAARIDAEKLNAKARKAQAKGQPRGTKTPLSSQERYRESAEAIGAQIGVSGTTVKRVDRLARQAPELLPKIASGELSVKHALREIAKKTDDAGRRQPESARKEAESGPFLADRAARRLEHLIRAEWEKWPRVHRARFLHGLQLTLRKLIHENAADGLRETVPVSGPMKPRQTLSASH